MGRKKKADKNQDTGEIMARNLARSTGMKRKGSTSLTKKSTSDYTTKKEDVLMDVAAMKENNVDNVDESVVRKRPKRAAACSNFKEQTVRLSGISSVIETKKNRTVEDEMVAVHLTKLGPEDLPPCRKLLDFILHDADGNPQPFEMSEIDDIFITALIMPLDDNLEKEKERGVKCEGFGRIETWAISGYDEGIPVIWVSTESADYECVKPASNYRKFYENFYNKAHICIEVYRKLAKTAGGNPNLNLDELVAGVIRSLSGTKNFGCGVISKDFVISVGEFVYNQLIGLDETQGNNDISLATVPALLALRDECISRSEYSRMPTTVSNGSLKIIEGKKLEADEDDDMKLARLLQEEEDWKFMKQQRGRRSVPSKNSTYIKISESEIANDYPMPAYYKPSVEEMDEYIFFETEPRMSYRDLPTRVLTNWALYNSDSRLISLELLPMKACAEIDVSVFGSGNMREDDGSGFCSENEHGQFSGTSDSIDEGVRIYLSAIKEWVIEFGASMIFVSIRTDVAWYRLGKPAKQYAAWYEPVLKTARLAVGIITLLKEQSRVSRLSFADVIKKVSEFERNHPAFISSNPSVVERYVVVHGQIILQQFADYPDDTIQKCSFITGLSEKMEQKHHTKLVMKKKAVVHKEANLNPSASMCPISKRKLMRATTTKLVNRIWGDFYSKMFPEDMKDEVQETKEEEIEEEQEEVEEEEVEEENTLFQENETSKSPPSIKACKPKTSTKETRWEGEATGKTNSGENLYRSAVIRGETVVVGMAVMVETDETEEVPPIYFVEFMFEKPNGTKIVHGRLMQRGSQTVLGNAAKERELFLTNDCLEFELGDIKESVALNIRKLPWGHKHRKENLDADNIERKKAEERKKRGLPVEYYCKSLYCPERGAFFSAPFDYLGLGTGVCNSCEQREIIEDGIKLCSKSSLIYKKTEYDVHDFVYARPQFFAEGREDEQGTFKAGRNVGLKPYVVCQMLEIVAPTGSNKPTPTSTSVKVRRFYRPEDISPAKAYCSDIREVYYSEEILSLSVEMLEGKCEVRKKIELPDLELPVVVNHIFFCEYSYDAISGAVKQLPANFKLLSHNLKGAHTAFRRNKGKGKCMEGEHGDNQLNDVPQENRLATLDIFAGCGGLSEGLQQAGVTFTKWAIEYEQPAGEAFRQNHPGALMFIDNCNVILRAIMEKCGDADDCISTAEADESAAKLDKEKIDNLPVPGQVDFINGGPPCQGFSGMNRFNHSTWSKVQCEMILAFLSFAEYFRPRYFLLENVRNFVSFNKGQTFRLTIASLLEMGYQVRFGILEAGAYGVSQSRKRAFIWAASPEETLPEWPEPMHVFAGPELKISLNEGVHYAAVRSTAGGAPFRPITVRDTIGDLPPVENGASKPTIDYEGDPVSWFQKQIRGNMLVLNDHISKEMNELNLIRCQHIPKRPGSDWRDLPDEKVKLSSGQMVDLIPWCLPNTAKRHNQWKGLFGRLDWEGNFPTSITDPQPMGKVGMCFHPDQDRILTVRECARSQGFRDSYQFCGNIQSRHRQIGNAVPPPLAYALGRRLKEAVDAKRHSA